MAKTHILRPALSDDHTQSLSQRVYDKTHTGRTARNSPTKHGSTSTSIYIRIGTPGGTTTLQVPLPSENLYSVINYGHHVLSAALRYRK